MFYIIRQIILAFFHYGHEIERRERSMAGVLAISDPYCDCIRLADRKLNKRWLHCYIYVANILFQAPNYWDKRSQVAGRSMHNEQTRE